MTPLSRSITDPPAGYLEQGLDRVPGLGGLYARGALGSVRAKMPGQGDAAPADLPKVTYRVDGLRVDADHLTAYQHLLRENAGDWLPSGYCHVLAFPVATAVMVRPDFPLPLLGMVHLANSASLVRPIDAGEELSVTAWTQGLRPHRRGAQLEVVAEIWTGGTVAWRGVSTYLAKGAAAPHADEAFVPDDDAPGPDFAHPGAARVGEEVRADAAAGIEWNLGGGVGREYGAISGDRNPIHMSALSAKAFGFPRAIAHGMYTAARALAAVGAQRGPTHDWTVEFAKPVLLPGAVALDVARADGGPFTYRATHPRTGKVFFTGEVTPTA